MLLVSSKITEKYDFETQPNFGKLSEKYDNVCVNVLAFGDLRMLV